MGKSGFWAVAIIATLAVGCSPAFQSKTLSSSQSSSLAAPLSAATSFSLVRKSVQLLPFKIRVTKMQNLLGSTDAALYAGLQSRRFELGDFDYAQSVAPDLTWTEARIQLWIESIQPLCSSGQFRARFPYPASANAFIKAAYGRETNATDDTLLAEIAKLSDIDQNQKGEMLCTVVLSSLEFLAP